MMAKKTSMAPSSFAAVSVVCQCAIVAVLVHTRLELSAVQEMAPAGPRRSLLEPAVMDDLREDNLRLTERIAALETEHRHITELCERDRGTAQNATAGLSQRVAELEQSARRRTQGAEPEPEPEPAVGENVKIIKPQVVRCGGPGDTTANDVGTFDYAQCADRAFATCHAEACDGHGGGHRRAQAGAGYGGAGSTCSAVCHYALGRRDNRDSQTTGYLRQLPSALVLAQTRTADPLDFLNNRLATEVFEVNSQLGFRVS